MGVRHELLGGFNTASFNLSIFVESRPVVDDIMRGTNTISE